MVHSPSWETNVTQLVKKILAFYGSESSLPCSQETATGPYPDESSLQLPTLFP
jgi:hypothetical protein